ncbi:MAG: UDP-glucose 4-epimerase GalE [Chitinophagaceae bacterium]|nr:UDP-glucose 4-epimerase GalE [Chitinophagaceae bacterium]
MKILVTGGAGYIGSHTIVDLIENGFEVVSIDNFSKSFSYSFDGIKKITGKEIKNYNINICDAEELKKVFLEEKNIEGVIHFAAYKSVNESVQYPMKYYENNMISLINILNCIEENKVKAFVFSSSCSVYGNAKTMPVDENTPFEKPECAYAATKQMGEQMVKDAAASSKISSLSLRYFNPVGAHLSAFIGENSTDKPNNLVPIITQTAIGKMDEMNVWGNDYNTKDGTCVRDYIHVCDVANAHTKAIKYLIDHNFSYDVLNLGIGTGVSVLEAIHAFEKVSGMKLNFKIGPRREGDVVEIFASNKKAKQILDWEPKFDIEQMMLSAWEWQKKLI